jgi:HlyD family secretion protein
VVAGQSVLRLIDPASLWVALRVDQGRSAGLAPGLMAHIALRSQPGQGMAGRVERVEPLADAVTEERLAMVAFDAPPAGVSVGEMAEVTLALPASAEGLLLPNAALQQHEGRTGVWRVQDGGLVFMPVKTGAQGLGGMVLVAPADGAALAEGDRVVLYSQTALQPDARIRVVESLLPAGGAK